MPAQIALARLLLLGLLIIPVAARADLIMVSNEKDNTISVLDADTLALVKTVPTGERPRGIVLSPDHRFLYICASDSDRIDVMDTHSLTITGSVPSNPDPELFDISPDGKTLYISNENNHEVSVVDIASAKIQTEKGAALDSFHVRELSGLKITSEERQSQLTRRLLEAIETLDKGK